MTTEQKRWWRYAVFAVISGGAIAGGWYSFRGSQAGATPAEGSAAAQAATPVPIPVPDHPIVAEVVRTPDDVPPAPPVPITPIGATIPIPIPTPDTNNGVVSAGPIPAPAPPAPLPIPIPSQQMEQPAGGAFPPVPSIPPVELPVVPAPKPPATPKSDTTITPIAPIVPEEPKPAPVGTKPVIPPVLPDVPAVPTPNVEPPKTLPVIPAPSDKAPPSLPPLTIPDPVKPDSGLNPSNSGNTLNPTVPPIQPIAPSIPMLPPGRDVVVQPQPLPAPNPLDSQREDPMFKLTTTAAFAVLSGALLSTQKVEALPPIPRPVVPMAGGMVNADEKDKQDIEKLKQDLKDTNQKIEDTNKKIEDLRKQIKDLKDSLNGGGDPYAPGALKQIIDLTGRIEKLEGQLKDLKSQSTSQKPAVVVPEKTTGTVKIINEYPVEISIIVNTTSYRVAPNKVLDVEVPAGDFSYQLITTNAQVTNSKIGKGETVRLRIK